MKFVPPVLLLLVLQCTSYAFDFYSLLEVDRTASHSEIKKSYRRLSLQFHPDKNPQNDANEHFSRISEAHDVLSDASKRRRYDALGPHYRHVTRPSTKGGDIPVPIRIGVQQLFTGGNFTVFVDKSTRCKASSSCIRACADCTERGYKTATQRQFPGFSQKVRFRDDSCVGAGICSSQCDQCPLGILTKQRTRVTLEIPQGSRPDDVIVLHGLGHESADGGEPGDIQAVLQFSEKVTDLFRVLGNDLLYTHTLLLAEALLGFTHTITHLDGRALELSRPGITKPNQKQVVFGEGLTHSHGKSQGDLIITYVVEFPSVLNEEQKPHISRAFGHHPSERAA